MPSYKVLKSVAHNIGHSFTSLMNYADDDYVMGHILRLARQTGQETLRIDFVQRTAEPPELLVAPIFGIPVRYTEFFWDMVKRQGSDHSCIELATLVLRFDIKTHRELRGRPQFAESPYVCDVHIRDIRGKDYRAHFDGWWYPERATPPKSDRPWWKLWLGAKR